MESTLSIQLSDIAAKVGEFLGYGKLTTSWSGWQSATPYVPDPALAASQLQQIMDSIAQGLRWFYQPQMLDKAIVAHKWSFLTQVRDIAVVANQGVYTLPDDYGGLDGELTYQPTSNQYQTIKRTGIGVLKRQLQQQFGMTQAPNLCAIYLSSVQGIIGQRWVIEFAPTPDASYTVTGQFRILPQMLTNAKPYPLGGEQHGETILAACLAAAEGFYNAENPETPAAAAAAIFRQRLEASISLDVQENTPTNLGYCSDRSDAYENNYRAALPYWSNEPTYNGTPFSQL